MVGTTPLGDPKMEVIMPRISDLLHLFENMGQDFSANTTCRSTRHVFHCHARFEATGYKRQDDFRPDRLEKMPCFSTPEPPRPEGTR